MAPRSDLMGDLAGSLVSNFANPCDGCITRINCFHAGLDEQVIRIFPRGYVRKLSVHKEQTLFHIGKPFSHFFNVRAGYLKLGFLTQNGQSLISQFAMPGDLIGTDGIEQNKQHLEASAITDGEICVINYQLFIGLFEQIASLRIGFDKVLSRIFNDSLDHIFSMASHSAEQKLAYFFLQFENHLDKLHLCRDPLILPMSRDELKSYLGMTAETLSRCFSYLEKIGCFSVSNREIKQIDKEKLLDVLADKNFIMDR